MPTQEGFLVVILVAIIANLAVAIGVLVSLRLVGRRNGRGRRSDSSESVDINRHVLLRAEAQSHDAPGGSAASSPAGAARDDSTAHLAVASATVPGPDAAWPTAGGGIDEPAEQDLGQLITTDTEAGLDGPATWSKRLSEENARVRRYGRAATIILVELTGVDRLADRLGSVAADRLIPPIVTTMRRQARAADCLARLGPSRFAALLPDTDEVRAINYVERVRSACDVWLEAGAVSLRLSIGWAEININQPPDPAFHAAESRLNDERRQLRGRDIHIDGDRGATPTQLRVVGAN